MAEADVDSIITDDEEKEQAFLEKHKSAGDYCARVKIAPTSNDKMTLVACGKKDIVEKVIRARSGK